MLIKCSLCSDGSNADAYLFHLSEGQDWSSADTTWKWENKRDPYGRYWNIYGIVKLLTTSLWLFP